MALHPLQVVHGDEPLLVLEAADQIRTQARAEGFTEREVLVVGPGFRWEQLAAAAGNLSLFGEARLIDLRIPTAKPGREGTEALQRYCRSLRADGGVLTLVTLPQLDWATRKAAWFAALAEAGEVRECNAPALAELPQWIAGRLGRQSQQAERDALAFIATHVEGNLLAAHQEILKLGLLYEPGMLSLDQVRAAVLNVARYDIEGLREALLAGDAGRCARLLDGLRGEGAAPPLVLWALATEIRGLAALRAGLDEGLPLPALFKRERIFERQRQRLMEQALPRLQSTRLRAALAHAARIDRMVKGVAAGAFWDECQILTLRVCPRV